MEFSEESKLLIEHWDTFTDAMRAYERLEGEEIAELVDSIVASIEAQAWSDRWEAKKVRRTKLNFLNYDWFVEDKRAVNVGIERLRPGKLFGSDDPPNLCVRIWRDCPDLVDRVLDELEGRGLLVGQPNRNANTDDAITQAIQKCPPGSPEGYQEAVHDQAMAFFEHYLPTLMDLDDVIQEELGKYRS